VSAADALISELSEEALDELARLLAPRLAAYTTQPDSGWIRGASAIAEYLGCPRSRVYSLSSAGRIAIERDGANLVARRSDLDAWIHSGGGRRP
jgi:excisionase family DNA binding protein